MHFNKSTTSNNEKYICCSQQRRQKLHSNRVTMSLKCRCHVGFAFNHQNFCHFNNYKPVSFFVLFHTIFFRKKKMNFQSVSKFLCMRMRRFWFKTILYISNDNIVKKINYSDVSQFVVGILLDFFLHIIKISYFIVKKLQAHSTAVVIEIEVKLSNQRRFRLILCAKYVC